MYLLFCQPALVKGQFFQAANIASGLSLDISNGLSSVHQAVCCTGIQPHDIPLERDVVWLDAGTADSLMDAGQTIRNIQAETGRYVGCLEELAFNQGWLTEEQVHEAGQELGMTLYGQYLQCL